MAQQGRILSETTVVALGVRSAIHCSLIYVCPSVSFYSFCFFRGAHIVLENMSSPYPCVALMLALHRTTNSDGLVGHLGSV